MVSKMMCQKLGRSLVKMKRRITSPTSPTMRTRSVTRASPTRKMMRTRRRSTMRTRRMRSTMSAMRMRSDRGSADGLTA